MVDPEAQIQEARELGFPLRLVWMLLDSYRQVRCLKAFNSLSKGVVAWQGNIAGCSHATTLLMMLTLRALRRAAALAPTVMPRALVDDITLNWQGPSASGVGGLYEAVNSIMESMKKFNLVMQPAKSGFLAASRNTATAFRPPGR